MAMAAAESCAILFGRRGGSGGGSGAGSSLCLLPAARPQRHLAICCRARRKSSSSQLKKQRIKRVSRGDPISIAKHFSNNDGTANFQSVPPENITLPPQVATIDESSDASICVQTVPKSSNGTPLPLQMESVSVGKNNYVDLAPTIHLEDLVGMIKDVEKNVLLLNEARIHAVKELDKISAEKDLLEKEVSMLQMKLEQNTAPNINAVRENNPSRLFGDSSKLPNEVCSIVSEELRPYLYGNGNGVLGTNDHLADKSMPSISEGLISLRKENTLLKDEVQTLKMKLSGAKEMNGHVIYLEKERVHLETSVRDLESRLAYYQEDVPEVSSLKSNCKSLSEKVENLQMLLDSATKQADQAADAFSKNSELQIRINMLEASLEEAEANRSTLSKTKQDNKLLQDKVKNLEIHLQKSEQELSSHIVLYQAAVKEFQETLEQLKDEIKKKTDNVSAEDMPYEFWSGLLLMVDGWLLERKISASDAKLLREMLWKRDPQIRDAYSSCKGNTDDVVLATLIKLISSPTSPGLHIIHIAAELAPVSKVGGLGDVVSGISKALQKRGHLLEIILPKYDCMNHEHINGMKMLDAVITSYFDGQLYKSRVWVGTVEGLPVYFIEPQHPANLFARRKFYGEHDDFKRFSFFSRAALELLYQSGKRADIIHCHDWHTAFVAPLYWDIYVSRGFDSARIFFTCHNFEYQGVAPASDLASCGLNVHDMNRPDRLQDNSSRDRINLVKGAIIFSNIVTTVSPTYAQEVCTPEGGKGLHETLQTHSRKFVGILNGIDCEAWNPSTDAFLKFKYSADDMQGKVENKSAIRKMLHLDSDVTSKPLVCCITRLVPQKGVHLIRHAIYRTVELGGQFVLLGSSPVPHIQREFEDISRQFERHRDIRLILKYDDALSHFLYAASDMIIIPSMFEPCGLTQMIAMRYGSVPIARNTGGLHDSVFDLDDDSFPMQVRNGFTFLSPDEHGFNNAFGRAFRLFMTNPDGWRKLVYRNMQADYSWGASSVQYEELYQKAVTRARAISHKS